MKRANKGRNWTESAIESANQSPSPRIAATSKSEAFAPLVFVREVSPDSATIKSISGPANDPWLLARQQQQQYVRLLEQSGARVESLLPTVEKNENLMIEHLAVLLPEVAIIARPVSSLVPAESDTITRLFGRYRPVQCIVDPGMLEGRDVLRIGRTLYVSTSSGANAEGIAELKESLSPSGTRSVNSKLAAVLT